MDSLSTKMTRQDGTALLHRHTQGTRSVRLPRTAPVDAPPKAASSTVHAVSTDCGRVGEVLSRIGDKWSVLVVMLLRHGSRRFSELKREIGGVSQRMLTLTLRGLERDGLVTRTVYPTTPPRVDYALTPLGHSLREPVEALGEWAFAHLDAIDTARRNFDRRLVARDGEAVRDAPTITHLLRLTKSAP